MRLFFFNSDTDDQVGAYLFRYELADFCSRNNIVLDEIAVWKHDVLERELGPSLPVLTDAGGQKLILDSALANTLADAVLEAARLNHHDTAIFYGFSGYLLEYIAAAQAFGTFRRAVVYDAHFMAALPRLWDAYGRDRVMARLSSVEVVSPYGPGFSEQYKEVGFAPDQVRCVLQPSSSNYLLTKKPAFDPEGPIVAPGRTGRDLNWLEQASMELDFDVLVAAGSTGTGPGASGARARYLARLSHSAYVELIAGAGLVVLPLKVMNCGMITLSMAMCLGRPVVASATEFTRPYARGGGVKLVAPGDKVSLKQAIVELVGSPGTRARMGEDAARFAARELYFSALFERIL